MQRWRLCCRDGVADYELSGMEWHMSAFGQSEFQVTRRQFLRGSSTIAAIMGARAAEEANPSKADALTEPLLVLPPHLSCPTETAIRIGALTGKQAAEATIELRKEASQQWEPRTPSLKRAAFEIVDWTLRDLSPATRYEYRLL